jgi:hypothetical protein
VNLQSPDLKPSLEVIDTSKLSKKAEIASLPLKELKPWEVILYVVAIVASMFFVDIIAAIILGKLFDGISPGLRAVIISLIYCMLGLAIADYSYRRRKIFFVLGIAIVTVFPVRFLLVIILLGLDSDLLRTAMGNTAIEAITVFISTMVFILLLRFTELKFNFAEIHDIEKDISDPKTKRKYDMGVCGKCGAKIKIAEPKFLSSICGKSERHFCDNCGIFLRTNPFKAILYGLAESIFCFVFMVEIAISKNTYQSILILAMLFGIFDGMKRLFAGIKGIIVRPKETFDKTGT